MRIVILLALAGSFLQTNSGLDKYRVMHVESLHYPPIAKAAGVQGEVIVSADVDSDGKVTHVETYGTRELLKEAAAANIAKWTFEPRASGTFRFDLSYEFVLRETGSAAAEEEVSFDLSLPHRVHVVASPLPADDSTAPSVRVIRHDPIHYPPLARQVRIGGVVKLFVVIDESGKIVEADVDSGHPLLRAAALDNLRTWKFEAPPSGSTAFDVTYEFTLRDEKGSSSQEEVGFDLPRRVRVSVGPPPVNPNMALDRKQKQ
jgi:TonB family protein